MDALEQEVYRTVELYEHLSGRPATRTRALLESISVRDALAQLMTSADLQEGFKQFRDAGKMDESFEAIVVRHADLFKEATVIAARWRLEHPYDLSDKKLKPQD